MHLPYLTSKERRDARNGGCAGAERFRGSWQTEASAHIDAQGLAGLAVEPIKRAWHVYRRLARYLSSSVTVSPITLRRFLSIEATTSATFLLATGSACSII